MGQESVALAIPSDHENESQNSFSASYVNSTTEESSNKPFRVFRQPNDNPEQITHTIEDNTTDEESEINVGQESVSLTIPSAHENESQNSVSASYVNSTTEGPQNKPCGVFGQPNGNHEQIPHTIQDNNADEDLEMNVGQASFSLANPSHHEDESEDSVPASYVNYTTKEASNNPFVVFRLPNDNRQPTQHTIEGNNTTEA